MSSLVAPQYSDGFYASITDQKSSYIRPPIAMRIILLSGPVASGKSTLSRFLEHQFGMTVLQTRELITRSLDQDRAVHRGDLQSEGERLDRETGGAWVRDGLKRVLDGVTVENAAVVDAVRTLDQVRILRDTYGSAVSHIHLTASDQTLSSRYQARSFGSDKSGLSAYSYMRQNETESMVDSLSAVANIVIDTDVNDKAETFHIACVFLRSVATI